ncbi:hypothetical protein CJ030_MR2G012459 [Morella rubra]|uniref:Apple domain-containing protein n=1 Tax=Morella rubra TaxID=262757 RepID=A0A6A1WDT8_9ROSI|nr:hypothetical protein CJ030_MR2G012459 [Morella rubra]
MSSGFAMVHPGNWTQAVIGTSPHKVAKATIQEDCQQACLEDCNCEAALFIGSTCRKQRLPLRYGRRKLDDSSIAFIKNHFWYRKLSCNGHVELGEDFAPRSFMYSELEQMTGGFKEELGRGSFGTVYKGEILNGRKVVAVKS